MHVKWRLPHRIEVEAALIDGDGLAYTMAGSDNTDPAQALVNMRARAAHIQRLCGGVPTYILLTMPGSDKGRRYAIATAKPYQGQRSSGRRPKNWQVLRDALENDRAGAPVVKTYSAEADDLFRQLSDRKAGNVAIYTQDKDMRMVPGVHVTWDDMHFIDMRDGADVTVYDKLYGVSWFWHQMLHGDSADNIPGLPKIDLGRGPVQCGEARAIAALADVPVSAMGGTVRQHYREHYGDAGDLHFLEQAMLLWMRGQPDDPFDVINHEQGPLKDLVSADVINQMRERLA